MPDQNPIRVGIVGAGNNTRKHHIPKLRDQENVEIVSVVNRSRESSQHVADEFDIPTIYDEWYDLVYANDTNAIVIGTWPYMHHPVTLAALDAGKHVMVEARMAMNATEAHEMFRASQQRPDLITQIVPSPMTLHLDNTIKRLIADGYLGDILAIDVNAKNGFVDFDGKAHWRHDRNLSGMNIMSLGIWYEALMRWVGTAKSVIAMGQTVVKTRTDNDGNKMAMYIPDHIHVSAQMVCGAQLSLSISSVAGLAESSSVTLYGTDGTLQMRDGKLYGGRRGDNALTPMEVPENENGGWRVEEEFISAIRGNEPITHTAFVDGVKYMEFTEAVHRSIAQGKLIHLPLAVNI